MAETSSRRSGTSRANPSTPSTRTKSKCCPTPGELPTPGRWPPVAAAPAPARPPSRTFTSATTSTRHRRCSFKACATGTHLKDGTITHRHPGKGQQEFLVIKLNDIVITGVSHGSAAGQPGPGTESVSLAFAKVQFEYRPQKADGSLDAGVHFKYDLKNNKTF